MTTEQDAGTPRFSDKIVHAVKLILADGTIADAEITAWTRYDTGWARDGAYMLELDGGDAGKFFVESPDDYFEALIELRKRLEPRGIKLLCFGARRDTFVSGMGRDMGAGLKAYLLSAPGEGRKPLQSIFDYAPPETIGTVDEQTRYYENWLARKTGG